MSKARQVLPGTTYFLTRRCSERRFFLRPDGFIVKAFLFVLAMAAKRYGVEIHCAVTMSDHWHAVVTDVHAKLPRFVGFVHLLVAKCVNVFRGRWENMWSSERYSAIPLHSADDVLDKIVYCLANPVRAEQVPTADQWPGLLLGPHHGLDKAYGATKPNRFFRKKSRRIPGYARILLTKPAVLAHLSDDEYVELVAQRLAEREAEIAAELDSEGREFAGIETVMNRDPFSTAKSWEAKRVRDPQVAARDKELRIHLIEARQAFLEDYQRARDKWRRGRRRTAFPAGTYWMRVFFNVRCAQPTEEPVLIAA